MEKLNSSFKKIIVRERKRERRWRALESGAGEEANS